MLHGKKAFHNGVVMQLKCTRKGQKDNKAFGVTYWKTHPAVRCDGLTCGVLLNRNRTHCSCLRPTDCTKQCSRGTHAWCSVMCFQAVAAAVLNHLQHLNHSVKHSTTCHTVFPEASCKPEHGLATELCCMNCLLGPFTGTTSSI